MALKKNGRVACGFRRHPLLDFLNDAWGAGDFERSKSHKQEKKNIKQMFCIFLFFLLVYII